MLKFAIFVTDYSVISDALMHGIEKMRPGFVRFLAALLLVAWSCFAPGPVVRAQTAPQKTAVRGRIADEAAARTFRPAEWHRICPNCFHTCRLSAFLPAAGDNVVSGKQRII